MHGKKEESGGGSTRQEGRQEGREGALGGNDGGAEIRARQEGGEGEMVKETITLSTRVTIDVSWERRGDTIFVTDNSPVPLTDDQLEELIGPGIRLLAAAAEPQEE